MRIFRVKVKNYRNFKEADVSLSKFNVLIGENGSGKSNFLRGIRNALVPLNHSFRDFDPMRDSNASLPSDFYANVVLSEEEKRKIINLIANESSRNLLSKIPFFDFDVEARYQNGTVPDLTVRLNDVKDKINSEVTSSASYGVKRVKPDILSSIPFDSLINIFYLSETREIPNIIAPTTDQPSGKYDVLNSLVEIKLNRRELYETIMEKAQIIAPELKSLDISFSNGHASATFSINGIERNIPSFLMSKGYRELFILLITLEFAPKESSIMIEEPEIHLHYSAIRELKNIMLDTIKEKNVQLIFTTHSFQFLSDLFPENDSGIKFLKFEKEENSSYSKITEIKTDREIAELQNTMMGI
ncbi:MAG: AAA family ATPase [Candidatus Thermoplasmatota archaeon]|nr:AAA family ATPase [Candidatus Thermoplasmatota archaeon]